MKNRRHKLILIIYAITVLAGVITVASAAVVSAKKDYSEQNFVDYSDGWTDENGEEADLLTAYKYSSINKIIPDLLTAQTLQLYIRSINVTIYVGDELVFSTLKIDRKLFGKTPGAYYATFILKPEDVGKVITINIDAPYGDDGSGKIMEMYFGNGAAITEAGVKAKLPGFVASCAIIFTGFTLICIYIPLRIKKIAQNSMMYLGILSVNIGIYMFFDNKLIQLLIGSDAMFHMASALWLLFLAVPMLLYFESQYECINQRVIRILCGISLMDSIVCYLLHITGIIDFHRTLFTVHLIFIAGFIYLMWAMIWTVVHKKEKSIIHLVAVLLMMLGVVTDLIILNFGNSVEQAYFSQLGTLAFLCIEISQMVGTHIREYQKGMKARLVSRLAYHDGLTDMFNRTSFMEDMSNIEEKRSCEGRIIAVFDVNYLKKVNDNLGHEKGDELIILASEKISQYFSGFGRCYRIGGDEFVCVTNQETDDKEFAAVSRQFLEGVRQTRTSACKKVSIAMGFEKYEPGIHMNMQQLFNDADAKMYDNKIKMKQQSE